jgi:hypothetical protein
MCSQLTKNTFCLKFPENIFLAPVSAYLEDLNRNYNLMESTPPQRENLRGNWAHMTEPREDDITFLV